MDLMADIGATNTRCALLDDKGQELAPEVFENADFSGVASVLSAYLEHRRAADRARRAAVAIAAPILGDEVVMTNLDWRFSQDALRRELGLDHLMICNDFAAVAWALPLLTRADVVTIGGGEASARATMATLGPGTGLGVSAIVPAAQGWAVVTGEGGHVTMPAATPEEAQVIEVLRQKFGHCSAERVLSGQGLENLYAALSVLAGRGEPTVEAEDVTALAKEGDPLARKTQAMFFAMLGTAAADLALTTGARGGVFVAGGIVPQLLDAVPTSEFRSRFEAKGRYGGYMARVPTYVITHPLPAFIGLRHMLGYY